LLVVSVPIKNDNMYEENKNFFAMLQENGDLPQSIRFMDTRTSVLILDDDSTFFKNGNYSKSL